MISSKNVSVASERSSQPNFNPKYIRRAFGAGVATVLLTVGASMVPGPSRDLGPKPKPSSPSEEQGPDTTSYEVLDGDNMTKITERELANSGIDPSTVSDMNIYVDPNVALNGGNTKMIPGERVEVIDIPNIIGIDLQNRNNYPPVDSSQV